jgi:hypothetical protein
MMRFWIFFAVAMVSAHAETVFRSGPVRVSLLELYTSEGCSSCPPAESWLSGLNSQERLWKEIVPVAFHVDYWDNLGWKDRFSKREYTARQRSYSVSWGGSSVYTPGFVLNGREWKGWFDGEPLPETSEREAGILEVKVEGGAAKIKFSGGSDAGTINAYLVPLAMNLSSEVRAGENRGRKLIHNFVALDLVTARLSGHDGTFSGELPFNVSEASALAVWITSSDSLRPIQAAGGLFK